MPSPEVTTSGETFTMSALSPHTVNHNAQKDSEQPRKRAKIPCKQPEKGPIRPKYKQIVIFVLYNIEKNMNIFWPQTHATPKNLYICP